MMATGHKPPRHLLGKTHSEVLRDYDNGRATATQSQRVYKRDPVNIAHHRLNYEESRPQ